jgi:hypothetical protein
MVKDFDDVFPFKSDNSFMTNADVPALAFRNLVHNPVNPFTGNSVDTAPKSGRLLMTTSDKFMPGEHHANTFRIAANEWYSVHSGIFDSANWQQAEE